MQCSATFGVLGHSAERIQSKIDLTPHHPPFAAPDVPFGAGVFSFQKSRLRFQLKFPASRLGVTTEGRNEAAFLNDGESERLV